MGLFTKGIEYNKLAMALNGIVLIIKEIDDKALNGGNNDVYAKIEQEVLLVAYMYRINIIDRIEKFKWSYSTPIKVPNISSNRITLEYAYKTAIEKLNSLSDDLSCLDAVTSILAKGDYFYQLEESLPNQLKIKLNQGL